MDRNFSSPRAALYRLLPGTTTPERVLSDVTVSNGLGWSGPRMYYVDTPTNRIDVFDYDPLTGDIENRRPFVNLPHPDGLCVDAEGGVWAADPIGGQLVHFDREGSVREVIDHDQHTLACTLGGDDGRTLFVCSAGEHHKPTRSGVATGRIDAYRVEVPGSGQLP